MIDNFIFQTTLSGEDVSLRPLTEKDFDGLFSCTSDKKMWEGHPSKNRYKKAEFIKWFTSTIEVDTAMVIVDTKTNNIIGSTRYYIEESSPIDISIGYTFISRAYWGGKTNFKVKKLMLDYAFNYFNIVWFHVSPLNIRSQKATQKIGAEFVCEKNSNLSGKPEPWVFYKINKEKWLSSVAS